jgi:hypothetical protein
MPQCFSKMRYFLLLFIAIPIASYFFHNIHFILEYHWIPSAFRFITNICLIILGILILRKSDLLLRFFKNRYKKHISGFFIWTFVASILLFFVVLPSLLGSFIDETFNREIILNGAPSGYYLYGFGLKSQTTTILYKKQSRLTMKRLGELQVSPQNIEINIKNGRLILRGGNKVLAL